MTAADAVWALFPVSSLLLSVVGAGAKAKPCLRSEQRPAALAVDCVGLVLGKPEEGNLFGRNSTFTIRTNKLTPTLVSFCF